MQETPNSRNEQGKPWRTVKKGRICEGLTVGRQGVAQVHYNNSRSSDMLNQSLPFFNNEDPNEYHINATPSPLYKRRRCQTPEKENELCHFSCKQWKICRKMEEPNDYELIEPTPSPLLKKRNFINICNKKANRSLNFGSDAVERPKSLSRLITANVVNGERDELKKSPVKSSLKPLYLLSPSEVKKSTAAKTSKEDSSPHKIITKRKCCEVLRKVTFATPKKIVILPTQMADDISQDQISVKVNMFDTSIMPTMEEKKHTLRADPVAEKLTESEIYTEEENEIQGTPRAKSVHKITAKVNFGSTPSNMCHAKGNIGDESDTPATPRPASKRKKGTEVTYGSSEILNQPNTESVENEEERANAVMEALNEIEANPEDNLPTGTERIEQCTAAPFSFPKQVPSRFALFERQPVSPQLENVLELSQREGDRKPKKPKKGSILEKLEMISAKLISEKRVREYERSRCPMNNKEWSSTKTFTLLDLWRGTVLHVIDESGEKAVVCLNSHHDLNGTLFKGCQIRIFPPWQMLSIEDSNASTVYMSLFKCEVLNKGEIMSTKACTLKNVFKMPNTFEENVIIVRSLLGYEIK